MNWKLIVIAAGLIFGINCAFCPSEEVVHTQTQTGNTAPAFEIYGKDGKMIKLSGLKGKLVLIDFWASWCGPCRRENPNVVEAYQKYHSKKFTNGKGFEVFSVSLDRNEEAWKKAISDDHLEWKNHGWDKDGNVAKLYSVYAIPTSFLIDGKGTILASGNELRGLGLHVALDKYLKK